MALRRRQSFAAPLPPEGGYPNAAAPARTGMLAAPMPLGQLDTRRSPTQSSPAFQRSLDRQRMGENRRKSAYLGALAPSMDPLVNATRKGMIDEANAGAEDSAGQLYGDPNHFQNRELANAANTRANAESGAQVGYIGTAGKVNLSNAANIDAGAAAQREDTRLALPARVAGMQTATAGQALQNQQIAPNAATQREAVGAGTRYQNEQTNGAAVSNDLAKRFGPPLMQENINAKRGENAVYNDVINAQIGTEKGRAAVFNAEAFAKSHPPQPLPDPGEQLDLVKKKFDLANQMGQAAFDKEEKDAPGFLSPVGTAASIVNGGRKTKDQHVAEQMQKLDQQMQGQAAATGRVSGPQSPQRAVNPKTGEALIWDGRGWVKG